MSQRVINELREKTGCSPVETRYALGDIKQVLFDSNTEYGCIATAAAEIDDGIGSGTLVWACGMSPAGQPIVGIQIVEPVDPDDIDSTRFTRPGRGSDSNNTGNRQPLTLRTR